jgi:hypothetical protein
VEPTQIDPIERGSVCLRTPATTPTVFIKPTKHKVLQSGKMLTLIGGLCCVGFKNLAGIVAGAP